MCVIWTFPLMSSFPCSLVILDFVFSLAGERCPYVIHPPPLSLSLSLKGEERERERYPSKTGSALLSLSLSLPSALCFNVGKKAKERTPRTVFSAFTAICRPPSAQGKKSSTRPNLPTSYTFVFFSSEITRMSQIFPRNTLRVISITCTVHAKWAFLLGPSQPIKRVAQFGPPPSGSVDGGPALSCGVEQYSRAAGSAAKPQFRGGSKTVGRWLKDRREKKKEETRAHNAQLHASVSVAGVAAAVAAIAAATAAAASQGGARKDDQAARTDMAVASAATLVAAQCVEAAEAMGAERDHLATVVSSAVNVRTPGDIITLTAAAATALRAAATLKARTLKEVWNIAAVIPVEKGSVGGNGQNNGHHHHHRRHHHHRQQQEQQQVDEKEGLGDELVPEENFLGLCSQELLARGTELLKRTRKGALHWKIVSVYIKRGQVNLKMTSKHVAGTITKKKKSVVIEVCKDIPAWPGRHLLEGGEQRRYFGLRAVERRVIEFECRSQREYEIWTQGVARLLNIVANKKFSA